MYLKCLLIICFCSYAWVGRSLNIYTICYISDIVLGIIPMFCSLDLFQKVLILKKAYSHTLTKNPNKQQYRFQMLNAGSSAQNLRKSTIKEIVFPEHFNKELGGAQKSSSPEICCLCNCFPYRSASLLFLFSQSNL